jgi:tryptophan 2-monooxygenase
VVDLAGQPLYAEKLEDLPKVFHEVAAAWSEALEHGAQFSAMQAAIRARDVRRIKEIWNRLIPIWDDRTFYGFIATSDAFMRRSFRHLEIFGQVGFGTGGWDTDFPNSMLEILRVVYTNCDEDQRLVTGGVEQMPRRLWKMQPDKMAHWPRGTRWRRCMPVRRVPVSCGSHRRQCQDGGNRFAITDRWGATKEFPPCWSPASPGC